MKHQRSKQKHERPMPRLVRAPNWSMKLHSTRRLTHKSARIIRLYFVYREIVPSPASIVSYTAGIPG